MSATTTMSLTIEDVMTLRLALMEASDELLPPDPRFDRLYDRLTAAAHRLGYEVPA